MRYLFIITMICIFLISCRQKAFPDSKFNIQHNVRDLISCYKVNDTLIFKSSTNLVDSFVISAIDSVTINEKPFIITPRNSKTITISYRQIPVDKWQFKWYEGKGDGKEHLHSEDGMFISVVKYPDNDSTEYYYNFKEFRCSKDDIPQLNKDSITINNLRITNYYKIENCAVSSPTENGIKTCYSTIDKGLVAFKTYNDIIWTRFN
jgi:hypothetical protein